MPNINGVSCYFDCRLGVSDSEWANQMGTDTIKLYNPAINNDYLEVVGSDESYGVLNHGGSSGSTITSQDYCTKYYVFKNLSKVFADWRTIIGNETGNYYCSTIAMNASGGLQFTRKDLFFNDYNCSDWHVIAVRSEKATGYTYIWCDGVYIGRAASCKGWGADTYLARGSSWSYSDNNTAYRAIIVSDVKQSDEEIVENSQWLKTHYIDVYNADLYNIKYLLADETKIYTLVDGALSELSATELTADLFNQYGLNDVPEASFILSLVNPKVLCWTSGSELPTLKATVTATPPTQIVVSQEIDLMHPSIKGIESVTIDCKGEPAFAVSFDNKVTWLVHDGTDWANGGGMTKAQFEAITTEQWKEKYEVSNTMYIKCTLSDIAQSVTSAYVDFVN